MATVRTVENKIRKVEGFIARILHPDGRDVRSDYEGLPNYNKYERAASGEMTVADWRESRFKTIYPGFEVKVVDGSGTAVLGGTKLGNVRDTYRSA